MAYIKSFVFGTKHLLLSSFLSSISTQNTISVSIIFEL
jgi:hypothetical protein